MLLKTILDIGYVTSALVLSFLWDVDNFIDARTKK